MGNYSIKDGQSVQVWIDKSEGLTEQSNAIMKGVSQVLEEIAHDSKGGLVDQMLEAANGVLTGTEKLIGTMKDISSVIRDIMSHLANAIDTIKDGIGGFIKGLF